MQLLQHPLTSFSVVTENFTPYLQLIHAAPSGNASFLKIIIIGAVFRNFPFVSTPHLLPKRQNEVSEFIAALENHFPGINPDESVSADDLPGLRDKLNRQLGDAIVIGPGISQHWTISPAHQGPMGSYLTAAEIDKIYAIVEGFGFSVERNVTCRDSMTCEIYELYEIHQTQIKGHPYQRDTRKEQYMMTNEQPKIDISQFDVYFGEAETGLL